MKTPKNITEGDRGEEVGVVNGVVNSVLETATPYIIRKVICSLLSKNTLGLKSKYEC